VRYIEELVRSERICHQSPSFDFVESYEEILTMIQLTLTMIQLTLISSWHLNYS